MDAQIMMTSIMAMTQEYAKEVRAADTSSDIKFNETKIAEGKAILEIIKDCSGMTTDPVVQFALRESKEFIEKVIGLIGEGSSIAFYKKVKDELKQLMDDTSEVLGGVNSELLSQSDEFYNECINKYEALCERADKLYDSIPEDDYSDMAASFRRYIAGTKADIIKYENAVKRFKNSLDAIRG